MFDYKGYDTAKLLKLCDERFAYKGIAKWINWTAEVYSFGKYIREQGFYPTWLPLHVYTDHGPGSYSSEVPKHEYEHDAYCNLYHSAAMADRYKNTISKLSCVMLSPFVWYRRKNNIEQSPNAIGTLAFPAHTTPDIDLGSDMEEYIAELKKLPEEFQPVCVCMHMHDIAKGQHEIFIKHGIPVYTAGCAFDYRFAERFYDIMKNFKYTTSSMLGSYTFYSVEMGIPFSVYSAKPILVNNSDPNIEKGEYKFQEDENYKNMCARFKGLNKEITQEQREFVEENLGIYTHVSRFEMAKILYMAYFKKGNLIKDSINALNGYRKFLKRKLTKKYA